MIDLLLSLSGFYWILALLGVGASGSLFFWKQSEVANWWGNGFAALASAIGVVFGSGVLLSGHTFMIESLTSFPGLALSFNVDRLSAFFVLVISLVALACSIFAVGYVRHYASSYSLGVLGFFYNLFIAGMFLVVTAHNLLFFLIAWELMSLTSYFLVVYEWREEKNVQAGTLYFVMTHVGTAFITFAFLILYKVSGSFDLSIISAHIGDISPFWLNTVFLLALVGFGTKSGIIPLHIWLPSAHPAAPTHVSALMSGVMIKTGIYMFARLFLDVLPHAPRWWGFTLLALGATSALLGVLYALTEHDLKRLLAYHSIENIGIILLGLGSALVFQSYDLSALAVIGLVAALYHTLNHATFKALLFLAAGSVISKMHTRNIEEYGGLIRFMPVTAMFFFIGAMTISALPPLNGFFSEWLTFQSLFAGIGKFDTLTTIFFVVAIGSLAFTGGLAATCFVKAFGTTFLARPRSAQVNLTHESDFSMLAGMGLLSLAVVLLGFFAGPVVSVLTTVATSVGSLGGLAPVLVVSGQGSVTAQGFATVSMPVLFVGLVLTTALIGVLVAVYTRKRLVAIGPTWNCGSAVTPRMEITATGFSRSIVTVFQGFLRPTSQIAVEYRDASLRYFPKTSSFQSHTHDIYRSYFYEPLQRLISRIADQVRKVQMGNISIYLLYIFLTLLILLALTH